MLYDRISNVFERARVTIGNRTECEARQTKRTQRRE